MAAGSPGLTCARTIMTHSCLPVAAQRVPDPSSQLPRDTGPGPGARGRLQGCGRQGCPLPVASGQQGLFQRGGRQGRCVHSVPLAAWAFSPTPGHILCVGVEAVLALGAG